MILCAVFLLWEGVGGEEIFFDVPVVLAVIDHEVDPVIRKAGH